LIIKYYGIKQGYPILRRKFNRFVDYIVLLRPFTLLAPIMVGLFLVIATDGITYNSLAKGVYVGITLALAQACGQVINQVVDADLDKLIKPYRPIPSGRVSKEEALGVSYLLALAAVGRAFTISIYFGLMVCVMLFFAVFYSFPPLSPRKVNPVLNLTWVAFSRGFLPIVAVMGIDAWKYAILSFIWAFGWQGTKDVPDVVADRQYGIKTIANTYGVSALKALSTFTSIIFAVVAVYFELPIFLLLVPLALYGIAKYEAKWKGENTVAWAVFYIGLGVIPILILFNKLFFV
jgi:geranylgeranylglycerol-phosphate geranylgeranyltransferase